MPSSWVRPAATPPGSSAQVVGTHFIHWRHPTDLLCLPSRMNRGGHAKTLVPAHPGNKNAQKAGVYSPRNRASRAAEIEAETEGVSARELRLGILRHELSSLLALSEAQDQALADEGVQGRRGQARSLVDQRLRTHDKLLRLARELEETQPGIPATTAAEERPTPPLNPEPLAQLVAEIHHESRIEDITPSDFSADAFLRAVVATQDPAVLLKNRATARRLLTKRRKNRPWSCTCFATRSARDDLELQDWIEEAREAGLRAAPVDAELAAIVRKFVAGERPPEWHYYKYRLTAIDAVLAEEAQRLADPAAYSSRRNTMVDDAAVRPFWEVLLAEDALVGDRLEAFRALDDLDAFGVCTCGTPERVFPEQEFDQTCGYYLRLLLLRNHRGAFMRVQLPETYLALRNAADERVLKWDQEGQRRG